MDSFLRALPLPIRIAISIAYLAVAAIVLLVIVPWAVNHIISPIVDPVLMPADGFANLMDALFGKQGGDAVMAFALWGVTIWVGIWYYRVTRREAAEERAKRERDAVTAFLREHPPLEGERSSASSHRLTIALGRARVAAIPFERDDPLRRSGSEIRVTYRGSPVCQYS